MYYERFEKIVYEYCNMTLALILSRNYLYVKCIENSVSLLEKEPQLSQIKRSGSSMMMQLLKLTGLLNYLHHARSELIEQPVELTVPRLVFESGDYFVQHIRRCSDNSRVATNREQHLIEQIQDIYSSCFGGVITYCEMTFGTD